MSARSVEMVRRATKFLESGFRCTIVSMETGLSNERVRDLHEHVHGCRPKSGKHRSSETIVDSNIARANASVLMATYARLADDYERNISFDAILRTYEIVPQSRALVQRNRLSVNDIWMLARDLRSGVATLERCSRCGVKYLFVPNARQPGCPFNCTGR